MPTLEELKKVRKKLSDALKTTTEPQKSLEIKGKLAHVYKLMADKVASSDFTKAMEYCKFTIDLTPEKSQGYLQIGKILQEHGKDEAALGMYKIGVKRCAESDKFHHILKSQQEEVERRLKRAAARQTAVQKATKTSSASRVASLVSQPLKTAQTPQTSQGPDPKALDPMTLLPVEVVENVFSHVPFRTIARSVRVSKLWKDSIEGMRTVWNSQINFSAAPKDRPVSVKTMERYFKLATRAPPTTDLDVLRATKQNIRVINLLGMHSKSQEYALVQWLGRFWFSIENIHVSLNAVNTLKLETWLRTRVDKIAKKQDSPSETITSLRLFCSSTNMDSLVRSIVTCMPCLTKLDVINDTERRTLSVSTPEPLPRASPRLETLRIVDRMAPNTAQAAIAYPEVAGILAASSATLAFLSLTHVPVEYTKPFSRLSHLELTASNQVMEIRYIPSFLAQLEHIRLDNHHTPHFLNSLNRHCSLANLRSLHLDLVGPGRLGSTLMPTRVAELFSLQLSNLHTLQFSNYHNAIDGWFELLVDSASALVHLDVSNSKLSDVSVLTQHGKLPSLEFLDLKNTQVSAAALVELAKRNVGMDITGMEMRVETFQWLKEKSGVLIKHV